MMPQLTRGISETDLAVPRRALTRRFWVLPNLFLKRPSGFISVTDFYNSCISMGDAPAASICSATTMSLDRDNGQIMSE
jgi:hypothetical protein